jgi:hypothetical protein
MIIIIIIITTPQWFRRLIPIDEPTSGFYTTPISQNVTQMTKTYVAARSHRIYNVQQYLFYLSSSVQRETVLLYLGSSGKDNTMHRIHYFKSRGHGKFRSVPFRSVPFRSVPFRSVRSFVRCCCVFTLSQFVKTSGSPYDDFCATMTVLLVRVLLLL